VKISEIFGPTIQGEGAAAGRHCLFVRLALCNLECAWCDTPYTWAYTPEKASKLAIPVVHDRDENTRDMTAAMIIEELCRLWPMRVMPTMVVISGGEPLMQQNDLIVLTAMLRQYGHDVHIETAGTLKPSTSLDDLVSQYNVSPKLAHSGNVESKRIKPEVLKFFAGNYKTWFKFVVKNTLDLVEIEQLVKEYHIRPSRVMVMPEGVTIDDNISVARDVVDEAIKLGFGLTFRSHILLWKDVRGK
jgi:7-carboxy-7-deazaguanine synthase